jgi:hypothetical protein
MHMWWFLIRRGPLSRIDDVIDPGDACMVAHNPSLAEVERLGLMRWKDKVCFCSISHTNFLHSNVHQNL